MGAARSASGQRPASSSLRPSRLPRTPEQLTSRRCQPGTSYLARIPMRTATCRVSAAVAKSGVCAPIGAALLMGAVMGCSSRAPDIVHHLGLRRPEPHHHHQQGQLHQPGRRRAAHPRRRRPHTIGSHRGAMARVQYRDDVPVIPGRGPNPASWVVHVLSAMFRRRVSGGGHRAVDSTQRLRHPPPNGGHDATTSSSPLAAGVPVSRLGKRRAEPSRPATGNR
jgi:hypothetical protein